MTSSHYNVFTSFYGPDVRRTVLSHLLNHFASKGITVFKDNEIERGDTIGPELVQAIGESRVSVVLLSKNYASSVWCLEELVEIFKCGEDHRQLVLPIFYGVAPSDVRRQIGDFGSAFKKTCERRTEEEKQRWIKALTRVANIKGYESLHWENVAEMIEKIATDVSKILVVTPSMDFDGMVGLEAHLTNLNSLLCLESDEVKMIGIWGPAGIGKTTIARALFNQLFAGFRPRCFMGNLKGKMGVDEYESKLWLQNQFLSKILNQRSMGVHHLGEMKEWLQDQKVLIVLDDVDDLEQLEALAKEPSWFGLGSRIIVTTEDRQILKAHWVNDIYHVDFPSKEEALEILCLSAFKQSSPRNGFGELAKEVVKFCGNLPLGLRVVGSSLYRESEPEWEIQLSSLEVSLDRHIEDVLRVGYDRLCWKDQSLFLHIACFFNYKTVDFVTTVLPDNILGFKLGLRTLADKSLVHISSDGLIVMHNLLQQFGRQVVAQQSDKPGKSHFLIKAEEYRDVLANETGTDKFSASERTFEKIPNLKYPGFNNANVGLLEEIKYLPHLRLLDWESYPRKSLHQTFQPKLLVEPDVKCSELGGIQNFVENQRVEPVTEEKKQENVSESSTMMTYVNSPPEHKVFINFCGDNLRHGFVRNLVKALERDGVNIYLEINELPCGDLRDKGIKESSIALIIFSSGYAESRWSLNELVKIKELMEIGKLLVIPIFYKVEPLEVTQLKGDFGVKFWNLWRIYRDHHIITWKEALESVASMKGIYSEEYSSESEFITVTVKNVLERISLSEGESTEMRIVKGEKHESYLNTDQLFGMEKRMEQLEKKLEIDCNETRIIGVVGLHGIGKTSLAMMMHKKWNCKFIRCLPLLGVHKKSEDYGTVWLRKTLLEVLLEGKFPDISDKTTHESVKDKLLQTKVFVVLDDVSDKKQLEFLLGDLDWIKKGSKIVITASDKSLLEGCAHDTYVVPVLNDREAFQLFNYNAFDDQICSPTDTFLALSRMFVDYARGHPMILNLLSRELRGKDKAQWKHKLEAVTSSNIMFQDVWRFSTDQLNERQKDVFLDIVCFFKSEDEYFVRSLVDSGDPDSIDTVSEVRDLANKFLIIISDGRVETNDLLYMFEKDLSSPRWLRLWNDKDVIKELQKKEKNKATSVRGVFLDMSKLTRSIYLDSSTFINMLNLRYLKIYDSCCPRQCKADCKLYFHDGFDFPLKEVRYLHWANFPFKKLPRDFSPENLVDLRLPYSKIERVWEGAKDTPRLKWVDLSYSSKLLELSALSKAENLRSLNLEGCSSLDKLTVEIQNMKSLVLLNLRGCIRLSSLPAMSLISLKILILSGCTNLDAFQLISESLEVLHLDGTAINGLPPTIRKLQRLVILNLKNCKMLECLPNCLGELKALEELILSGCSRLKNISDVRESMKHLQSLLIDKIGAREMPNISCVTISEGQVSADMFLESSGVRKWPHDTSRISSLQRLSLSGNDFVNLQTDIGRLYDLKWLDVTHCKKLRSIPMLPPRLRYFDAHGCDSLERVANPLALPVLTEHNHATFNFSYCNMLDQDAKNSIISYTRWKSQLVLDARYRFNGGSVLEDFTGTCFPGWEVPAWFSHRASGSVLKTNLPPHWFDNRFTGIALCAVIFLPGYYEQRNRLVVKCYCVFYNKDGSCIRFSCTTGSWSRPSKRPGKIEQSHVFIGYTSMLDIKKHGKEDNEEGCIHNEASFEFQVTDGMEVLEGCEVLKCGFSLVCATDEREDANTVTIPERIENILCEARSSGNSRSDDSHNEGYSNPTLNIQNSFENKRNEESEGEREIIGSSYHDYTYLGNLEKLKMHPLVGLELRLKQMEKVLYLTPGKTRIVGVVGMPGIGKTTLATILFEKRGCKFPRQLFLTMPKKCRPEQLRRLFLKELLKNVDEDINDETRHETLKDKLLQTKVFVVLDDVRDKKQLEFLLGNLSWIKKGSKIVITTCDKSLLAGLAHDTYVVQRLSNRETFQLFTYHAFYNNMCPSETFLSLSRMFVDIDAGNPLDLKLLGSFLCGKDEASWEHELKIARQRFNTKMRDVWRFSIDQLNDRQKYAFLDMVYFFKSEDEDFVRSILDLGNPEAVSNVRDLADKFLLTVSGGRVEMHDQLYTLGKELGSPGGQRLWNCRDIIEELTEMKPWGINNVRGIFLDMSEMTESIALECTAFSNMRNLLYLKIYDSCCPRQCKADRNLYFPDGLELPLEEVRYLHWVKFPLEELPPDFRPANLVDLRLPYSRIERVWEGVKVTPHLKWVDLRHSTKLLDLTSLSKAENLQRLNLEGCTCLDELPMEIENMKSLVFLNLRGCIRLSYLPKMNLISLKTLILSDCSNLKEFQLISESVEFLHLDGTSIQGLPPAIQNLRRLVMLNLKNCKMLECLPNCLGKLEYLDELILSGCSSLKNLPDVRHSLKHLQILLLDGTGANEMPSTSVFTGPEDPTSAETFLQPFGSYSTVREWPCGVNDVSSSLRRLCLSGNNFVCLQQDIGKLYNLNRLDLKHCKKLKFVPTLPPRLQYFDAHGCDSLERVANPLALPVSSEQSHSTFIFSECIKLDHDAKDSILSYSLWRSQLMLDDLTHHNEGFVLEALIGTCFPGWEVPAWFSHRASGSVLKTTLPPHWCDNKFPGIALCAVILFPGYHERMNHLLVKCNCVINYEDGSHIRFSYNIGSWSEPSNTPGKIESSHVFIGYTSMLDIKKYGDEEDKERCSHTEATFEFQVTDGTKVLEGFEVQKCGFGLVYATDELRVKCSVRGAPVETNHYKAYSENSATISNVRKETGAAEKLQDRGHEIVELEVPLRYPSPLQVTSPQPHITESPASPPEYGTGSNNYGGERYVRASDVDTQLSGEHQHLSADLVKIPTVASSPQAALQRSHSQVFVSFHGAELRRTFVRHLVSTLTDAGINVYTDNNNGNGIKLQQLYKRIEESKIALVIFSKRYIESNFHLNELVTMDKLSKEGKLLVIPVFYNVRSNDVKNLKGEFGKHFKELRIRYKDESKKVLKWETSVKSIAKSIGIHSELHGLDAPLVEATVEAVERALTKISHGNLKSLGGGTIGIDHILTFFRDQKKWFVPVVCGAWLVFAMLFFYFLLH